MWPTTFLYLLFINFILTLGYTVDDDFKAKREENVCRTPDGDSGRCIIITECRELFHLLRNNRSDPQVRRFLTNYHCGYEQKHPKVCCKQDTSVSLREPTSRPLLGSGNSSIPDHLPQQCGDSIHVSRFGGGQPADLRAWPWIALLGYTSEDPSQPISWKCSGTLVSRQHVVTAAHCLGEQVQVVRLGDLDITTTNDEANHIDVPVDKSIPHPEYNKVQFTNNIGIVRLKNPVAFTLDVRPICLPFSDRIKTKDFDGFHPFIAGWSSLQNGNSESPTHLMESQAEIKPIQDCRTAYANLTNSSVVIDDRVICAGHGRKSDCHGDYGGPLMFPENTRFYLLGIVSYGNKCTEVGFPVIYTKVSEFTDWIAQNTS